LPSRRKLPRIPRAPTTGSRKRRVEPLSPLGSCTSVAEGSFASLLVIALLMVPVPPMNNALIWILLLSGQT
ncbi:MAG: hypothetical protein IIT90_03950, partial [Clostridiales bacterium]|nr:hypothetical protein [Clostridiales bacterium]